MNVTESWQAFLFCCNVVNFCHGLDANHGILTSIKENLPYCYVERVQKTRQRENIERESWLVLHNQRI